MLNQVVLKKLHCAFLLFASISLMACGSTDFSGTNESKQAEKTPDVKENKDNDVVHTDRDCTKRPQNILMLDFKSGWWAGDGGDFFKSLLSSLTAKCKIKIEYHHIALTDDFFGEMTNMMKLFPGQEKEKEMPLNVAEGFAEKDWNKYTQIWVLSGSKEDLADIKVDDEFFMAMMDELANKKKPNVFVGSGYGSITHANAVMSKLQNSTRFATDLAEGLLLNPEGGIKVATTLAIGQELDETSELFRYLDSIADHVRVDDVLAAGDYLESYPSSVRIVGKNTEGRPSIATAIMNERRFVFDAGLQRYYAVMKPAHEGTYALIRNIIRELAEL